MAMQQLYRALRGHFWDLWLDVIDRPLPPPTTKELTLVEALRASVEAMGAPASAMDEWQENSKRVRARILQDDPRSFLRWTELRPMCTGNATYLRPQISFLRGHPEWSTRLRQALVESPIGHPTPYWTEPRSSGTLIHHVYHALQLEQAIGLRVPELGSIVEFGGGFGSICRVFYTLGFRGAYHIYDLPLFSALQTYYLSALGLRDAVATTDLEVIRASLTDRGRARPGLFVATWSLSEAPLSLREHIVPLLGQFDAFLFAFQEHFADVDNLAWFDALSRRIPGIHFQRVRIPELPADHYLFGRRLPA